MPEQNSPKIDELLRWLNAATDKSQIRWDKTADPDAFRAELGNGMVRLFRDSDTSRVQLTLIDNEGVFLDEFKSTGSVQDRAFEDLFKKARNQALNIDHKLQGLFDELKVLAS